jgi:hypothetical protein
LTADYADYADKTGTADNDPAGQQRHSHDEEPEFRLTSRFCEIERHKNNKFQTTRFAGVHREQQRETSIWQMAHCKICRQKVARAVKIGFESDC